MGRSLGKKYPVRGDGRMVLLRCSLEEGDLYERAGMWRREYDSVSGRMLGYRVVGIDLDRGDEDLRIAHVRPTLGGPNPKTGRIGDIELCLFRSRTFGLPEFRRQQLIDRGYAPEDRVERVRANSRVYREVGAAKGDILRVWPK